MLKKGERAGRARPEEAPEAADGLLLVLRGSVAGAGRGGRGCGAIARASNCAPGGAGLLAESRGEEQRINDSSRSPSVRCCWRLFFDVHRLSIAGERSLAASE